LSVEELSIMKWVVGLYGFLLVYAVVRYVVFTPKNLENVPVFVVNKCVAMAAALCFVMAFYQQLRRQRRPESAGDSALWFRAGVFGAIWHIPMALTVLRPGYFKEFFAPAIDGVESGRLSLAGEVVFCFGGLAAGMLYLLTRQQWSPMQRWWMSLGAMLVLMVHVLAMGYCRGLNINASHGYLPPMWLLSAAGVLVGVVVLVMSRPRAGGAGT
jgi:hypothetical protein